MLYLDLTRRIRAKFARTSSRLQGEYSRGDGRARKGRGSRREGRPGERRKTRGDFSPGRTVRLFGCGTEQLSVRRVARRPPWWNAAGSRATHRDASRYNSDERTIDFTTASMLFSLLDDVCTCSTATVALWALCTPHQIGLATTNVDSYPRNVSSHRSRHWTSMR